MSSRDYFKGKRIAVVGLGPHAEMVADIKFLIKAGALVALYDLRSEARLKNELVDLREAGLAASICGSIPADDLLDVDLIILSHEYPRDSSFLKQAAAAKIKIEYPETLFFRLAPPITLVGVMGAHGKATVMSMLAPMLESITASHSEGFHVVDSESDHGILAHLKEIKGTDIVLARLDASIMRELHALRVSPHIALFTGVPLPDSYEESPFDILAYQTYNNFIIGNDRVIDATHALDSPPKSKMLRTKESLIPSEWGAKGRSPFNGWRRHDRDNAALALQAARLFKVPDMVARETLENWKPLKGRLESVKKVKQVEFYNDSASVSAGSTEAAIQSVASADRAADHDRPGLKNIVLLFGGCDPAGDYHSLYAMLSRYVHTIVLLPGSGTMKERRKVQEISEVEVLSAPTVEEAVWLASQHARKGDKVLFSPSFSAGGLDRSRAARGERFVRAVRAL